MTLNVLIKKHGGPDKLAETLGVNPVTVKRWVQHKTFPNSTHLLNMFLLSNQKLDLHLTFREYFKHNK
jgi:hypothetical protein